ncbi:undecaprenyl-diphosphatase [Bacillus cereus group sp. BfR-BA-01380]|uniref:undecaprenyl-diphosphatase n=1 Tax=Bacillus cereus group sp. BfR-BA-01380 TaxID=2920324 RepID=UPI001F5A381C|nr:undecaprenyl-diphosphatase [Bacillus cereus group sp. BfR-BA-01380]
MDYKIFRAINQFVGRYPSVDAIMIMISRKARYVYVLLLILMWFRSGFYKKITIQATISACITLLINFFIKRFYFRPRPFVNHNVHILPPIPSGMNSSFPSKHTMLSFAVATSILFYNRLLGWFLWLLAFLTGLSRIWNGQHYPSDIIGSALIGSITSIVVNVMFWLWNCFVSCVLRSYNCVCNFVKIR